MTSGVPYTPEETEAIKSKIIQLIVEGTDVTFAGACQAASLAIGTAYEWKAADEKWRDAVAAARKMSRETGLDFAESVLMKKIRKEESVAVLFYLKTQGKDRGYVERQINQLEGGDKPIGINGEFTLTFGTDDNDGSGSPPA